MSTISEVEAPETGVAAAPLLGEWRKDYSQTEWKTFVAAVLDALEMEDSRSVFRRGHDLAVGFRKDLIVSYWGEEEDDLGSRHHVFLFTVPDRLIVTVFIEDDGPCAGMYWCGDPAEFQEVAFQLRMFDGAWLDRVCKVPEPRKGRSRRRSAWPANII